MRRTIAVAVMAVSTAACGARTDAVATAVVPAEPEVIVADANVVPYEVSQMLIPDGTMFHVRLEETLGPATDRGEFVTATLVEPILASNGEIILPVGTIFNAEVKGAVPPHGGAPGAIRLNFEGLTFEGLSYPVTTRITDVAVADAGNGVTATPTAVARGEILDGPGAEIAFTMAAPGPGTIIALGSEPNATLPAGTTLMLQNLQDIPLHSNES